MASPPPPAPVAPSRAHLRGLGAVLIGASLWGLSGTAAQILFQRHGVSPQWLVMARMLGAGSVLLLVLRPAFPRADWKRLLLFAVAGVAAVQYTYFAAIALTNVATATFLQYTSVPMIAGWEVARGRARMTPVRAGAIVLALAGTALLAVGGRGGGLALNPLGAALGLLSAAAAAFYTLSSVKLVNRYGAWPTTGWGFLAGSVPFLVIAPPWTLSFSGSPAVVAALIVFVVVFGTLLAFGLYLASFRTISPTEAAITATAEPVAAAVAAFAVLGVALLPLQYAGGAAIVAAVVLLRRPRGSP